MLQALAQCVPTTCTCRSIEATHKLARLSRHCQATPEATGMLTVRSPSSVPALNTLTAISPLLAHRMRLKGVLSASSICTPIAGFVSMS